MSDLGNAVRCLLCDNGYLRIHDFEDFARFIRGDSAANAEIVRMIEAQLDDRTGGVLICEDSDMPDGAVEIWGPEPDGKCLYTIPLGTKH